MERASREVAGTLVLRGSRWAQPHGVAGTLRPSFYPKTSGVKGHTPP